MSLYSRNCMVEHDRGHIKRVYTYSNENLIFGFRKKEKIS